MYIIGYTSGQWGDYREHNLFVTKSEKTAKKWLSKANKLYIKLKNYYNDLEAKCGENECLSPVNFERSESIREFNEFFFRKIKVK